MHQGSIILLIFLLVSTPTVAAESIVSELDYYQELPVVLSASRLSQPLSEAPNAMTVIDRKMITSSGFRNIADLFKLVPGMYVSYYKGSQPFVSYHGSTDQYARRMQVMIDGRSVYMPPLSAVDWAFLPITIEDIERIEVIRGPAAASHGANSTQGVISITTRDAGAIHGGELSVTRGTKGINDMAVRFGGGSEFMDYRMTIAYSADNGYDNIINMPNNLPYLPSLLNNNNDSNQARLMNYRADYHPDDTNSYDIQFGYNHDVQGVGFTDKNPSALIPLSTNGNTPHDLFANNGFAQLGWTHQLQNDSELVLRYFHERNEQHESFPVYLGGTFFATPVVQSLQTSRDELELQHTLTLANSNRLVYGAAYRVDEVNGNGYIPPLNTVYSSVISKSKYRVFAHDEWRLNDELLLNTGGMFEKSSLGQENFSPRAALNYHLTQQHTLRIGASVAYRTPALVESNFPALQPGALFIVSPTITSPGLVPERMVSREIGYLGESPETGTSLDLRVFNDHVSRAIYFDKAFTGTFVNGMAAVYHGVEATFKQSYHENIELTANFAHEVASSNGPALQAAGQTSMIAVTPGNNDLLSASIPRNSASLLYSHTLDEGWSYSASYYFQSELQPYDRGLIDRQPTQHRTDMRVAKSFSTRCSLNGEVALVVQNLFNQGYSEYIVNNVFNRRAYITMRLDW